MKNIIYKILLTIGVAVMIVGCLSSCLTAKKVEQIVAKELAKKNYLHVSPAPYNWQNDYGFLLPQMSLTPIIGTDTFSFYNLNIDSNAKRYIDTVIIRR